MAEAYKCDVVDCNQFSEGSPAAKFVLSEQAVVKSLCQNHTNTVINQMFPDLLPSEPVNVQEGSSPEVI